MVSVYSWAETSNAASLQIRCADVAKGDDRNAVSAVSSYPHHGLTRLLDGVSWQDRIEGVEDEFRALAEIWRRETALLSNLETKCMHPAYQRIIGLGPEAVPFLIEDLRGTHAHWFWALSAITGQNPVSQNDVGNVTKMIDAWLSWAQRSGYGA